MTFTTPAPAPRRRRPLLLGAAVLALATGAGTLANTGTAAAGVPTGSTATPFHVFARSFHEDSAAQTVTLPLYSATSGGRPVSFVVTDASTRTAATLLGVNWAPRLANARGTAAVQRASLGPTGLQIPALVDFRPTRVVVPGPTGFPPAQAVPGAVGEPGYSPLIQLPDGTVLNAPQVENNTGRADKVVSLDRTHHTLTYRETNGFYDGKRVHYVSFEASIPLTAALENASLAPALNAAPPDDPRSTGEVTPRSGPGGDWHRHQRPDRC